jgi:hypothetical protein
MTLNQAVLIQVHDLDKIHLLALAGIARILPNESLAVREISGARIQPLRRLPGREKIEQRLDLLVAAQKSTVATQKMRDERTFKDGIFRIERQQRHRVVARRARFK